MARTIGIGTGRLCPLISFRMLGAAVVHDKGHSTDKQECCFQKRQQLHASVHATPTTIMFFVPRPALVPEEPSASCIHHFSRPVPQSTSIRIRWTRPHRFISLAFFSLIALRLTGSPLQVGTCQTLIEKVPSTSAMEGLLTVSGECKSTYPVLSRMRQSRARVPLEISGTQARWA